jgi:hypothetical protein
MLPRILLLNVSVNLLSSFQFVSALIAPGKGYYSSKAKVIFKLLKRVPLDIKKQCREEETRVLKDYVGKMVLAALVPAASLHLHPWSTE